MERIRTITLTLLLGLGLWDVQAQIGASVNIIVNPTGIAANSVTETAEQPGNSNTLYTIGSSCDAIARITSTLDLGTVTIEVVVDDEPGIFNGLPFVGRYYAIHPSQNANSSATIVLYFSQEDFDAYNQSEAVLTGAVPPIAPDGSNLLITAFHGLPSDGSTGPNGTYDANNKSVYTPSVTINSSGYFEATFTIDEFSGFFAHTNNSESPLPLLITSLSAQNFGNTNKIKWTTAGEFDHQYFEIERCNDAQNFHYLGKVEAIGDPHSNYYFNDIDPKEGNNYYRLKIVNLNGDEYYSSIVSALVRTPEGVRLFAYPNPMVNILYIRVEGPRNDEAILTLKDPHGRCYFRKQVPENGLLQLNIEDLASGMYFIQYQCSSIIQTISVIKN